MNGRIRVAALLTTLVCAPIAARQTQPPQFGAGNRTVADNAIALSGTSFRIPKFDGNSNPRVRMEDVYGPFVPVTARFLCAL